MSDESTKERLLQAAGEEFAAKGFAGARVEQIAIRAGANKAMLFYYFRNKRTLYSQVLLQVLSGLMRDLAAIVTPDLTPERFLEEFPRAYITFFARHPLYLRLIGYDLILDPENVRAIFAELLPQTPLHEVRERMFANFRRWAAAGRIHPVQPLQMMLNIVSLCALAFIARPLVETFSGIAVTDEEAFVRERIAAVTALLQKGILK